MSIYIETKGTGENIVVIHGGCANYEDMTPVVESLASHYRVTNVGLPGSGRSDWDPSIKTIHDIADAILPVMPENAIYVGWSFGGLVSQSIAARYPDRVKRFIGLGASPKFIAAQDWIGFPQPGYRAMIGTLLEEKGFLSFLKGYYDYEFSKIEPKPEAYYQAQKICEARVEMSRDVIYKLMEICDATDLREEFESIHCPIDLIIGDQDENVPQAAWGNIKALNPRVRIHAIKSAGHTFFWTHPEEFKKILQKVL